MRALARPSTANFGNQPELLKQRRIVRGQIEEQALSKEVHRHPTIMTAIP